MKLLRFRRGGRAEYGLLEDDAVYELVGSPFAGQPGKGALVGPVAGLEVLAPCEPSKIICAAYNYPWGPSPGKTADPFLFYKPPSSVIGHEAEIVYPTQSEEVIFESELAIVIGRTARNVKLEEARDYVLGYTCANDATAYDFVKRDVTNFRGKSFDTLCPLGPVIETDLDPGDAFITCRVNGEVRASGSTKGMYFSCEELIAYAAGIMTLYPGDLILTGTPNVGEIKRGDVVEVEIAGIGTLRNRVV